MTDRTAPLRRRLDWDHLLPSLRAGVAVVVLFAAASWLVGRHEAWLRDALAGHGASGLLVFFATSALAVLVPLLTNLPLVPLAVLAWGPWWTAGLLLAGWIAGAALSFALGRHLRGPVLRLLPAVRRHADVDRLLHPRHRMLSLVLLRMTFPVDVLSYALGLFSLRTTAIENAVATALGAAPFALLFSWVPLLAPRIQLGVLAASTAGFLAYLAWLRPRASPRG